MNDRLSENNQNAAVSLKAYKSLIMCIAQTACSVGSDQRVINAHTNALKTCNAYLSPRFDGKSVDIPDGVARFTVRDNTMIVRWPFRDERQTKTGSCTTSADGDVFISAEVLPEPQ